MERAKFGLSIEGSGVIETASRTKATALKTKFEKLLAEKDPRVEALGGRRMRIVRMTGKGGENIEYVG